MKIVFREVIQGRILDIGGGGEGIIGRLYPAQVTAIDKYQEELDEAPDGFEKIRMDATQLQFADASFDNVTFFYTLMYMLEEEQRISLNEAVRVLKYGGNIYIWDADIRTAYPEPFYADLDITLPDALIHTTYAVVKPEGQTAGSIKKMCLAAGLTLISQKADAGHFCYRFRKDRH